MPGCGCPAHQRIRDEKKNLKLLCGGWRKHFFHHWKPKTLVCHHTDYEYLCAWCERGGIYQ